MLICSSLTLHLLMSVFYVRAPVLHDAISLLCCVLVFYWFIDLVRSSFTCRCLVVCFYVVQASGVGGLATCTYTGDRAQHTGLFSVLASLMMKTVMHDDDFGDLDDDDLD